MNTHRLIEELREDLNKYKSVELVLGNSYEKPLNSIEDGYPGFAVWWLNEALIKVFNYWVKSENLKFTFESFIEDFSNIINSVVYEKKQILNQFKITHHKINDKKTEWSLADPETAIEVFRDFIKILSSIEKESYSQPSPEEIQLNDDVKKKVRFTVELFDLLKFKLFKFYTFTADSAYLLFNKTIGIKHEYNEVFITDNQSLLKELVEEKKSILDTKYPISTSTIISDNRSILNEKHSKVFTLEALINKLLNYQYYTEHLNSTKFYTTQSELVPLTGELLSYKKDKQDFHVEKNGIVDEVLESFIVNPKGNLFVISKPGGGKTSICKSIFEKVNTNKELGKYVLYFDLSRMESGDQIEDFLTNSTSKYFNLRSNEIFDVICFLNNRGKIIILLDGLDEIFDRVEESKVYSVFGEISKLFTKNSKIVITSRHSFLLSSKQLLELLDRNALISDKVGFSLNTVGIDPLQLPNFKILKLNEISINDKKCSYKHLKLTHDLLDSQKIYISPLEYHLIGKLSVDNAKNDYCAKNKAFIKSKLILDYIRSTSNLAGLQNSNIIEDFIRYFFVAYQNNKTCFNLVELFTFFGKDLFLDNIPSLENMIFNQLFQYAGENEIKFKHKNYYEFIFSLGYMKNIPLISESLNITDEIRKFISEINLDRKFFKLRSLKRSSKLLVPAGKYIIGDHDRLKIGVLENSVVFDETTVTVKNYNKFLDFVRKNDISEFEHPYQPKGLNHEPNYYKLKKEDYYSDPKNGNHPAICISWWSAFAYANYKGKRLPTSLEWECAARGNFGNLFSWGSDVEIKNANCADFWAKKILVTYDNWKKHYDASGFLRGGETLEVDAFPRNVSPFGIRNMCGNVWEFTSTITEDFDKVIICGGSYDNPFRAIKCSSKGISSMTPYSNAVGFRCCSNN